MEPDGRHRQPVCQPCLSCAAGRIALGWRAQRVEPAADRDRGCRGPPAGRRAGLPQDAQPGRIRVRPRLGRCVEPRRRGLLSQIADQCAVHACHRPAPVAGRSARSGAGRAGGCGASGQRTRPVIGTCHLHRARPGALVRSRGMAASRRYPVSLGKPGLCLVRRFSGRIVLGQTQEPAQGTRRRAGGGRDQGADRRCDRARTLGCVLGVLSGHRRAQMGSALPDAQGVRSDGPAHGGANPAGDGIHRRAGGGRRAEFHRPRCDLWPVLGIGDRQAVSAL